jgi:hypothetical protein
MTEERQREEITKTRMLLGEFYQEFVTDEEIAILLGRYRPFHAAEIIRKRMDGPK